MMRPHLALALVVGGGATLAASCGGDNSSHPPYTAPPATGGSAGHAAGGGGGTKSNAGEAGSDAGSSAGGAGGQAGEHSTNGSGGTAIIGAAGVPFSGDMGARGGTGGGGGAPGPGDGTGHLYIGPGGYDAATGTRDDPFATLAGAVAVAERGDTIVYLAGNYSLPELDDPIVIPDGVDIAADQPRLVALNGSGGALLDPAGDTNVDGIRFSGFATVLGTTSDHGKVTITNSSFSDCPTNSGASLFEVAGGASVTLSGDTSHDWGDCPAFAHVLGNATFALDGGLLHFRGAAEPALFSAEGAGKLQLMDLIAVDGNRPLLLLADTAQATLTASTLQTLASNTVVLRDRGSLDATNTDFSLADAAAAPGACIQSNVTGTSSLTLAHSNVHGCSAGVSGTAPTTLSITDTELYSMSESGLDLGSANSSTVTLEACTFYDDGLRAARFGGDGPSVFYLSVRGTTVHDVPTGFDLDGDATSSWDFGTLADPGRNTLTASTSSLVLSNASVGFVSAVGDTWNASVQGADEFGQYQASDPGGTLEVTSGSGQNYTNDVGATLRLAENP
jgi:hypothetical protein